MGGENGRLLPDRAEAWPRVASDEPSGVFRVRDPRVFRAGGRAFCRLWLASAVRHPGVVEAGVDLATATARIEFEPGSTSTAEMAATFSRAVREALGAPTAGVADRSDWVALAGFAGPDSPAWEVSRRSTDRIELRPPGPSPRRADWLERVALAEGVTHCRAAWFSDALTVAFDSTSTNEGRILEAVRNAWLESRQVDPRSSAAGSTTTSLAIDPRARVENLAKAGGLFVLTLVGVVVPGIPTLPFLLGTSYYLARSSPALNASLRNSPIFGSVLREWEEHGGLSLESKAKLLGLSAAILTLTLLTIPIGPLALIPILLISAASVYATLRIPGLPVAEGEDARPFPAPGVALG